MDYPSCQKKNCINWKQGHCIIKEPEKTSDSCLNFQDEMDALRLRPDNIKKTID